MTILVAASSLWLIDGPPPHDNWMHPVWVEAGKREGNPLAQFEAWLEANPITFGKGGADESWDEAEARKGLSKYASHFAPFDKLMGTKTESWYWSEGPRQTAQLAPKDIGSLVSTIRLQASRSRAAPNARDAIQHALALIKCGKGLSKAQGSSIHILTANTTQAFGLSALKSAITRPDVNVADLDAVTLALEGQEFEMQDLAFAMKVDYEWFKTILLQCSQGRLSVVPEFRSPQLRWLVKPDLALRNYEKLYGPLIRTLDGDGGRLGPALEKNRRDSEEFFTQRIRNLATGGTGSILLQMAAPVSHLIVSTIIDSNARLALARAQVALRRQEKATGRLPESLQELIPPMREESIHDPWTEHAVIWSAGSQKLYSAGRNGRDDGGQIERVRRGKPLDLGDIYWWSGR